MQMPELYFVEMDAFLKSIIEDYVEKGRLSKTNIDALLSFLYRNHYTELFHRVEEYSNKVNVLFKSYMIAYGYCYDCVKYLYKKLIKMRKGRLNRT